MKTIKENSKIVLALIFLLTFGLFSCSKDDLVDQNLKNSISDIFYFADDATHNDIRNKVLAMNLDELRAYEDSLGYCSFGRKCDEIYNNIDEDEFLSEEDITKFVEMNSEYLQFIDIDGELYLETVLYDNPNRYLINDDKVFQIGEYVYKVFADGMVRTNQNYKGELLQLSGDSLPYLKIYDENLTVIQRNVVSFECDTKDDAYNCGTYASDDLVVGSEKIFIRIMVEDEIKYFANGDPYTKWTSSCVAKPYRKTLNRWYGCGRHITYEFNVAVDTDDQVGNTTRTFLHHSGTNVSSREIEVTNAGEIYGISFCHFGGYDCNASIPATDTATVKLRCNVSLF